MLKLKRSNVYLVIALPLAAVMSYVFLGWYSEGDQIVYRRLYESLSNAYFGEVTLYSLSIVSGAEPIYAYLMWIGAQLNIDKNIYISFFNSLLIGGIIVFLRANKAPVYLYLLVLSNLYVLVLLTGAERLKFAYIILIMAACIASTRHKTLLLFVSPFAHLQSFIMMPSIALAYAEKDIKKLLTRFTINAKILKLAFLASLIIIALLIIKFELIAIKVYAYMNQKQSYAEVLNLAILSFVALIAARNKFRMALVLLPMFPAVQLLGGERVNMIAVTLVFYYLTTEQRLNHPLLIALMIYFSIQGAQFAIGVFNYGDGFIGLS